MTKQVDLHIHLAEDLITRLDRQARAEGLRRMDLLREAIREYLERKEREQVEREMTAYVEALAAHSDEFVRESAAQTHRRLLKATSW